uniref:Uncharacterized protein n=1 Tax=Hyaloperonospora arabidopsidis (strain Emoy2) TaxID=559515 RepID=M4B4D1_HYAAE
MCHRPHVQDCVEEAISTNDEHCGIPCKLQSQCRRLRYLTAAPAALQTPSPDILEVSYESVRSELSARAQGANRCLNM